MSREYFAAVHQLDESLRTQHRDTVLAFLVSHDVNFNAGNDASINAAMAVLTEDAAPKRNDINWQTVLYDKGESTYYSPKRKPVYSVPVFGHNAVQLNCQSTLDYAALTAPEVTDIELINAPSRSIELYLSRGTPGDTFTDRQRKARQVKICISPDMPPTAVNVEDLVYIMKQDNYDGKSELLAISRVKAAFGDEALEVLSTRSIGALTRAVLAANTSIETEY